MSDDSPVTFGLGVFGLGRRRCELSRKHQNAHLDARSFRPSISDSARSSRMSRCSRSPRWSRCSSPIGWRWAAGRSSPPGTPAFSPAFFAPGPKDAFGIRTFPAATNTRPDWGAGFQLGLVLRARRQLEPRLLVQEPGLAGEDGTTTRRLRDWSSARSASRRDCPRSSRGASPTRASNER